MSATATEFSNVLVNAHKVVFFKLKLTFSKEQQLNI